MEVPLTPVQFLRRAQSLYAQREAVVEGNERRNYAQLFERVARLAKGLQDLGVGRHERVACVLSSGSALLEAHMAVARIGAVLVPLSPRLGREDYRWILRHCRAKVLIAHAELMDAFDAVRRDLLCVERFVAVGGWQHAWLRYEELLSNSNGVFEPVDVDERDPISIEYVVRDAPRPRGVVLTHRNAWVQAIGTLVHTPIAATERFLWSLPMHHTAGWGYLWSVTALGATHVMPVSGSSGHLLELIGGEAVGMLAATPTVLAALVDEAMTARPPVRRGVRVLTGGDAPDLAAIERAERELGWQVTQVYGLTETAGFVAIDEREPAEAARTDGRQPPRQGVETLTGGELRVLDEHGSEVPADGVTVGEVHVRGNAVMFGYYEDPPATARALRGGWLRTGDRGVLHHDGRLELRERRSDVIVSGGERIAPAEIEQLLLPIAGVREVAVLGLPDERLGEVPHAFVLVRKGCTVTAEQLAEVAKERLAPFKRPVEYHFLASMPRTAAGLPDKRALQQGQGWAS
jgi:fatty-acyl-CoA synthase